MAKLGAMKSDYDDAKNNFSATVDPTANDDITEGYDIGSRWINPANEQMYVCVKATDGQAAWKKVTDQGGGTPAWGAITGTLSNQTDLSGALDGKLATTVLSGLSKITVGTSAPGSPTTGDLWVDCS